MMLLVNIRIVLLTLAFTGMSVHCSKPQVGSANFRGVQERGLQAARHTGVPKSEALIQSPHSTQWFSWSDVVHGEGHSSESTKSPYPSIPLWRQGKRSPALGREGGNGFGGRPEIAMQDFEAKNQYGPHSAADTWTSLANQQTDDSKFWRNPSPSGYQSHIEDDSQMAANPDGSFLQSRSSGNGKAKNVKGHTAGVNSNGVWSWPHRKASQTDRSSTSFNHENEPSRIYSSDSTIHAPTRTWSQRNTDPSDGTYPDAHRMPVKTGHGHGFSPLPAADQYVQDFHPRQTYSRKIGSVANDPKDQFISPMWHQTTELSKNLPRSTGGHFSGAKLQPFHDSLSHGKSPGLAGITSGSSTVLKQRKPVWDTTETQYSTPLWRRDETISAGGLRQFHGPIEKGVSQNSLYSSVASSGGAEMSKTRDSHSRHAGGDFAIETRSGFVELPTFLSLPRSTGDGGPQSSSVGGSTLPPAVLERLAQFDDRLAHMAQIKSPTMSYVVGTLKKSPSTNKKGRRLKFKPLNPADIGSSYSFRAPRHGAK